MILIGCLCPQFLEVQVQLTRLGFIETMLADPNIESLFIEYCQLEFAIENILCYQEIREFRRNLTDPLGIYFRYFNRSNSPMEVNVPVKACEVVFDELKTGKFDVRLFDELERIVIVNLSDTWGRFQYQNVFINHINHVTISKEMIEGK
jgi:hypothetical protein